MTQLGSPLTFEVSYKIAILHYEENKKPSSEKPSTEQEELSSTPEPAADTIPPVIHRVEPALGPCRYNNLKENPIWLYKLFKVCEPCAQEYSKL
jgi:hypothetical protein